MRWSLRTQLIAVVLVAGLPSVVVLAFDTVQDQDRAEEAAEAEAQAAAREAIAAEQRILDRAEGTLAALAVHDRVVHGRQGDCDVVLRNVRQADDRFVNLAVVDQDRHFLCTSFPADFQPPPDLEVLTRAEWDALAADPGFHVDVMRIGPVADQPILPLSYPVFKNGTMHRVVLAGVAVSYLQDAVEEVANETGAHVLLVDSAGNVMASSQDLGAAGGSMGGGFIPMVLEHESFRSDVTGRELLYHVVPLEAGGGVAQVHAVAGVPEPDTSIWTVGRLLAGGGAVTALVAVTYLGVDRTVQRPSERLREATERFMAGDLGHRVDTRHMPSELAAAGEALNQMAPQMAITQRGLERLVDARTRELERSNRDLEDFAYAASHDLRQPVRSITGYLDLVGLQRDRLDEGAQMYLDRARRASLRMQDLIDGLLAYSRVTTDKEAAERVDVGKVVADVVDDLTKQLEETGGRVEVEGALPPVHATPAQVRLVFQNLISNGIKFVPEDREPRIRIRGHKEAGNAIVEVEDNGIGIEPRYAEKVFGMFQRLHPRDTYPGHGIGLAVVKRIVEHHGGAVTLQSTPGQGTVFRVRWPLPRR